MSRARSARALSKAVAKAVPSLGSVPAPTSSNSTRTGALPRCSASRMRPMRFTWPLKVDRLCCRDCSSPMSASTWAHQGKEGCPEQGKSMPARAISAARPMLFRVTVLPPVFGPVIATTRSFGDTSTEMGTTGGPSARRCCHTRRGCRNPLRLKGASGAGSSCGSTPPSQRP